MRALVPFLLLLAARPGPALAGPAPHDAVAARRDRRARLAVHLGPDGYALLLGQPLTDVLQPRQEGHFLYLTGVEEPGAALLVAGRDAPPLKLPPGPHVRDHAREILFLRDGKPRFVQFYGLRHLPGAAAAQMLGVESALPAPRGVAALAARLAGLLPANAKLHLPAYRGPDQATVREIRTGLVNALEKSRPDLGLVDLTGWLRRSRAVKDAVELAALRAAVAVTVKSFLEALPHIHPGSSEGEVDGALLLAVRRRDARPAYGFVVATGPHGAIPHWFVNRGPLRRGDLLLIDAGAAVDRYAADITRVFPVSGRFTPRQREVYAAVLAAQRAGIAAVRPGATIKSVGAAARAVLAEAGLAEHFIHGIGHHLGLDVHDPGVAKLAPGMTITVEPGVYLQREGFGVRIEDVVLVTGSGCEVLSRALPKDPDEIEKLLAKAR